MKKTFYTAIAVCGVLTAVLWVLAWRFGGELLITLLTTAATTFYHLLMRLVIGFAVHYTFPKQVNPQNRWFRERKWEKRLWKLLRIRKWAKRVPTFDPAQFDVKTHTPEQLARQMCLSETVHILIVVCGYCSLLFCFFFEDPAASLAPFLITAVLAGLYDLQFVLLQRYNRPKVLRLIKRHRRMDL